MRTPVSDRFVPTAGESAGLGRYPEYRDSGVEWLGEIPAHWEVRRLKKWLETNARVLPENTDPDYEFDYIDIGSVGTGRLLMSPERIRFESAPSRARRVVRHGDTIVSTVRTYLKAVWHAEQPATDLIASTGFAVLGPRTHIFPRFISYLCQSESFTNRVAAESSGVSYPAIAESKLGVLEVSVPSFSEQRGIAGFLDRETARIDALVAKQHELIKLLQEKRTALISHAVRKGLDPSVAMKDSGVEWLGEIPAHWQIQRLRTLASITTGGRDTIDRRQDGKYPFFVRSPVVERIDTWSFDGEAVLTAGDGVGVAKVFHYANGRFDFHQRVYKFSDFDKVIGKFFFRYFGALLRFETLQGTAKSTVDSLRLPMLQNFPVVFPPLREQHAIIAFLDHETANIDTMIAKVNEAIEHLSEYRIALISAAVTGKIDVRRHGERAVPDNTPTTQAPP